MTELGRIKALFIWGHGLMAGVNGLMPRILLILSSCESCPDLSLQSNAGHYVDDSRNTAGSPGMLCSSLRAKSIQEPHHECRQLLQASAHRGS